MREALLATPTPSLEESTGPDLDCSHTAATLIRMMNAERTPPRDPRSDAPVIAMDLTRPDDEIHRDLRARYPRVIDLWWELEEDEKSGWVWNHTRVLAKLVQS